MADGLELYVGQHLSQSIKKMLKKSGVDGVGRVGRVMFSPVAGQMDLRFAIWLGFGWDRWEAGTFVASQTPPTL